MSTKTGSDEDASASCFGSRPSGHLLSLKRLHQRRSSSSTLRVGPGQNSQILFISVEQLSLNVADDSAKTLSVLGNMGNFLDDCCLRFLQMWRRPPQKYPRFWGPTDFSKKIPEKDPAGVRLYSALLLPLTSTNTTSVLF